MTNRILKKIQNVDFELIKRVSFLLLLSIFLIISSCKNSKKQVGESNKQTNVLAVTDIHFDPYHDSLTAAKLIQTPYENWDAVFSSIKDSTIATYNHETTPALLELLLKSISEYKQDISALLFTGDILAHEFNEMFYKYTGDTVEKSKNNFIYKTVGYVSMKFRQTFPNTPMYFSLGNNDSYKGDYAIVDNGSFLHNTTDLFYENFIKPDSINHLKEKDEFYRSYHAHGYYNLKLPILDNCRIIGLNTIFFSVKYSDTTMAHDPGKEELEWLEKQLAVAEEKGEKVWLLLHIPPGVNVYTTQHKSTQEDIHVFLQWHQQYNEQYLDMVQRYNKTIAASFAGHTHMDDFRLIYNEDGADKKALDYIHITPAVSPVFGNNPSFQIFEVDKNTCEINETATYYVDLSKPQKDFKQEYKYISTYQVTPNLSGLDSLYQMLPNQQQMLNNYSKYYPVSSSKASIATEWKWYWSGIGSLTAEEYIKAYTQLKN